MIRKKTRKDLMELIKNKKQATDFIEYWTDKEVVEVYFYARKLERNKIMNRLTRNYEKTEEEVWPFGKDF